jgi:uncharacterized protein (TIGR03437 family)
MNYQRVLSTIIEIVNRLKSKTPLINLVILYATFLAAHAQSLTTLVTFNGPNGEIPSGLIQGADGAFYGTTNIGGSSSYGTIFRVTTDGEFTTLHSFASGEGIAPVGPLVQTSDGSFYGVTQRGGGLGGYGTIFRITPAGVFTTIYAFLYANGMLPVGGLVQGSDGNFYGTTSEGGAKGLGTVFKITPAGTLTLLYSFGSTASDGANPLSGLVQGPDGNLYGTTLGNVGPSTIFKITPAGALTTIYVFDGAADPEAPLVLGTDGNFYGTTNSGGPANLGMAFSITPTGLLTVLYNFGSTPGDGANPGGALLQLADGNFYGTTSQGGIGGVGTVFKLSPSGNLTTLYSFIPPGGQDPTAGLIQGSDGNLYGTTSAAGGGLASEGTVFRLRLASGDGGDGTTPTISSVVNNSSLIAPGFPNGGIAPSTLFQLQGSNLASATTVTELQDSTNGLPVTLNGATVTIQSGGKMWNPGLYYAIGTQIAGVLPHDVPPGPALISVTYNNGGNVSTSEPFNFTVVPSAFSMDIYNGNYAVLQDTESKTGAVITPTNSAKPGQVVTLWGTGLGADPNDSDTTSTSTPHPINTPVQIYVGTVQVPQSSIAYVGSLGYPGVNGIIFTVPDGVQGCGVSLIVVANNVPSNTGVISVMPSGGVCQDSYLGIDGNGISGLTSRTSVNRANIIVSQSINFGSPTGIDAASGSFQKISGPPTFNQGSFLSVGSCAVSQVASSGGAVPAVAGLDAGTINLMPPDTAAVMMQTTPQTSGSYQANLASGAIPSAGGTFTFTGLGGKDVGPFTTTINFPAPISWVNQSAAGNIDRSQGITVTWSGGVTNSAVVISGSSIGGGVIGSFTCIAPQPALQFTVPAYISGALPGGTGSVSVGNSTALNSFAATGLDYGFGVGFVSIRVTSVYR